MTDDLPTVGRRELLRTGSAFALASAAGCLGGGGDGSDADGGGSGADGSGPGDGSGSGDGSGGSGTGGTGGPVGVGQTATGDIASLTVESVQPVSAVRDFRELPDVGEGPVYGHSLDAATLSSRGRFASGMTLHGVGVAIRNVSDRTVDVSTTMLSREDGAALPVFLGRTQRLTITSGRNDTGVYLLPGEVLRGEVVFPLADDPSAWNFRLDPRPVGALSTERLTVDLGAGAGGTASYDDAAAAGSLGETLAVGDLDLTVHAVDFVEQVERSPYDSLFGPRPGYRYAAIDLSATRTSDVMYGQEWSLGVHAADGYDFTWGFAGTYQDATDLERPTLDELAVGETIEHTLLAFPIEDGFEPGLVTMHAPGPIADPAQHGADEGTHRGRWRLE